MKKELSHRSHELKALGWNQEDLTRYEDLWDYSQRWGINKFRKRRQTVFKEGRKVTPKDTKIKSIYR